MSSSDQNQKGESQPRSTRSTRSNTSVPDDIVHNYVSERRQTRTSRQTQEGIIDSTLETIEEQVTPSEDSTRGSEQTEVINPPEIEAIDEGVEEKLKEELVTLEKGIRELELSVKEVAESRVPAQTPPSADITLQNKTPRPDTPTTHVLDETNDSDNESTCTVVENFSQEDISKYISFATDTTPFDHTVEHYFTPGEFPPDNETPLTGLEAVKRTLFTINGSVSNKADANSSGSKTNEDIIGETPKHGFAKNPITPSNTGDTDDNLDDTITDEQDTVKKQGDKKRY